MKSKLPLSLVVIAAIASPVAAFAKPEQAGKAERHAVRHAHRPAARATATTTRSLPTTSAATAPAMKPTVPAKPK